MKYIYCSYESHSIIHLLLVYSLANKIEVDFITIFGKMESDEVLPLLLFLVKIIKANKQLLTKIIQK